MNSIFKYASALALVFLLNSCGTTHQIKYRLKQAQKTSSFFRGFVLYNPKTKKEIINKNGQKYFTPASNTKLYTFYTAFKTLADSVPALAYYKTKDSLIIKGTADPSFLYDYDSNAVLNFLKKDLDSLYLLDAKINETPFGSGWSWDDYPYDYMPEKSLLPIYGNLLKISIDSLSGDVVSFPQFFKNNINITTDSTAVLRAINNNTFYILKNTKDTISIPFISSNKLISQLLSNLIDKKVKLISETKNYDFKTLYSLSYDDLYKKMLHKSDNFIAEQLMLQVGYKLTSTYSVKLAIEYSLEHYLSDLPQKPRWVDGSGLSRYNLFTPNDMVFLLNKMYSEIPFQKLLSYFPVGGKSGTLKHWYANDKPYVYAKSGTLSNNYALSGFLITKKGTTLIFSYMNNHFKKPLSSVKKEVEKTLKMIYNKY